MSKSRMRRILLPVSGAFVLLLALIGPSTFFYVKWMRPTKPLLSVEPLSGTYRAGATVSETQRQAYVNALVSTRNSTGMPSVSAAIAYDGSAQWLGAVGYSDLANAIPATVDSRYRLGSVSKALTGTLLARLLDDGVISLDAKASEYFSDLPAQYADVTVRMLASHTSGVRHYSIMSPQLYWPPWHPLFSRKQYSSVEDGLSLFLDDELEFEPGTGFTYSTYGYSLLARLMEGAAGRSFESLLQTELFAPAGLNHSAVDTADPMQERVSFYTTSIEKYIEAYPTNASHKIAGGGIVSTASDLVMLGQILLGEEFVSEEAKLLMWAPVTLPDGTVNPQGYGLGWRIHQSTQLFGDERRVTVIHHGGSQMGGTAFFMLIPELGVSVAALANTSSRAARDGVERLCYELVRLAIAEGLGDS